MILRLAVLHTQKRIGHLVAKIMSYDCVRILDACMQTQTCIYTHVSIVSVHMYVHLCTHTHTSVIHTFSYYPYWKWHVSRNWRLSWWSAYLVCMGFVFSPQH